MSDFKERQLALFRDFVRETAPVSGLIVAVQRGAIRFFGDLSIEANRRLASMPAEEAASRGRRLSAPGSAVAPVDATAEGWEPKTANPGTGAEREVERWIRECSSTVLGPGTKDDSEEKREKNAERRGEKRR